MKLLTHPLRREAGRPRRSRLLLGSVVALLVTGLSSSALVVSSAQAAEPGTHVTSTVGLTSWSSGSGLASWDDSASVELGVKFVPAAAGEIRGIRFYKTSGNTGTHVGSLWSSSGSRLAKATFADETSSGWQTAVFAAPVKVAAGRTYTASYLAPRGHYAATPGYFAAPRSVNGLTAPGGSNGVFRYTATGGFPTSSYKSTSYWVDVLYSTAPAPAPTTTAPAPAPTTTAPAPAPTTTAPAPAPTTTAPAPAPTTTAPAPAPTTTAPAPAPTTTAPAPAPTTTAPAPAPTTTAPAPAPTTTAPVPTTAPVTPPAVGVPSGQALKPYAGPSSITTAGAVIDGADITGGLEIRASNVIVRNSRISGSGTYGLLVRSGSVIIQDSTVVGFENGIAGDGYTARRVLVTKSTADGFKIGSNVTIDGSVCRDLAPSAGSHADCGQIQSGVTNVVMRGSWFDPGPGGNAALFMAPDLGPSSNGPVLLENNTFGGGNFSLFILDGNWGQYFIKDITVRNNKFVKNAQYGPVRVNVPVSSSGNTWLATGLPVSF